MLGARPPLNKNEDIYGLNTLAGIAQFGRASPRYGEGQEFEPPFQLMMNYKQCLMRQGARETTRWIPQRGAKVGATVEMLPERDWWEVARVYDHALPEDVLKEHQLMHRNSLPSVQGMK